jgi:hypothetical protein
MKARAKIPMTTPLLMHELPHYLRSTILLGIRRDEGIAVGRATEM